VFLFNHPIGSNVPQRRDAFVIVFQSRFSVYPNKNANIECIEQLPPTQQSGPLPPFRRGITSCQRLNATY